MTSAAQPTYEYPTTEKKRGTYRKHFKRDKTALPPFILQERDVSILQAVFENRFLTVPLLAQLFPPNEKDRARRYGNANVATHDATHSSLRRRLAKLFHHAYLHRFRTIVGGEHIYAIDTKGVQLLKEKQIPLPLPDENWRLNKEMPATLFVDHTLMVARFRAALLASTRVHEHMRLASFEREGLDLKAEWRQNGKRVYVNPDAFFILRDESQPAGKQHTAFFLEADRSTMTLARLISKYKDYSAMYTERIHSQTFGIPSFRVLTICKSKERASNALKLAIADNSPIPKEHRSFYYFTTDESYAENPQNVLAAVWRRTDTPQDLRAIIASPLTRT